MASKDNAIADKQVDCILEYKIEVLSKRIEHLELELSKSNEKIEILNCLFQVVSGTIDVYNKAFNKTAAPTTTVSPASKSSPTEELQDVISNASGQ